VTRDPADAAAYAAVLSPREVVAMPVVTAAPAADPDALARALATGPFAAIVVASPRAAAEFIRAGGAGAGPVWAVGPATERALADAFVAAHHPSGVRTGADLARSLVAAIPVAGKRVLVPRAEQGRTDAMEILRSAGADVVDVIAYRSIPTAAADPAIARGLSALRAGRAEICASFAPSQVAALAALVGPLREVATRFCAIGETTAAALRLEGVSELAVAREPTPEGVAEAVKTFPAEAREYEQIRDGFE
jgi:uroporphyrinogen-III synthase